MSLITSFKISANIDATKFIRIKNGRFERQGKPYFFMGTNFWQGMNLGAFKRDLLLRELDSLKNNGITQLRILALTEGPSTEPYRIIPAVQKSPYELDESLLVGLDFLLHEMSKRDMTAVVCLSNFWPWSGGLSQWVSWSDGSSIPYPPPHPGGSWSGYQEYTSRFYSIADSVRAQQESVKKIVSRINTITKKPYAHDPTIMSWQLANEPRGGRYRKEFLEWIKSSAVLIKSLDPHHLVTLGSEGDTLNPTDAGNNFIEDHSFPEIDYATIHIWVENWGVYNPLDMVKTSPIANLTLRNYINEHARKSKLINKPLVLEEFGLARDNRSMNPNSTTKARDAFYENAFKIVLKNMETEGVIQGVNFWAWSGESRPRVNGGLWKEGDPLTGDPPHEEQGWYGVYNTDRSTLRIIKEYSQRIKELAKKL